MIVWGGQNYTSEWPPYITSLNTGGRLNPASNTWTPLPIANAPSPRWDHTAVWSGSEMIVWGKDSTGPNAGGGRYNPASNLWTPLPTLDQPAWRYGHTAVWDGTQMIVWGGYDIATGVYRGVNTGGFYDPIANTWRVVTTPGAPVARLGHTAVWAGSEMVVWGGRAELSADSNSEVFDDAFGYTPARTMFLYLKP
jgi:hypothetical protein